MDNFTLSNTTLPAWVGGPPSTCSICKFVNHAYPFYVIFNTVHAEQTYEVSTGTFQGEQNIHLCSDHAAELKTVLDEVMPDERLPKMQGRLLQAEAARARAEKRAEAAENALAAMQELKDAQ